MSSHEFHPFISRPFSHPADLARVRTFMHQINAQQSEVVYLHVGDVLWQLYQNTVFDPVRHFRLWEDEAGELVALAWHEGPDGVIFQVRPDWRGRDLLEPLILAWGATHVDKTAPTYDGHLWTRIPDTDSATLACLTQQGFQRDDWFAVNMHHPLAEPVILPPLPDGFTVRAVGEETEWEARVNLHRDVWHPSRVTLDAYQRLRQIPGYDPELDLVVVAPDGEMVAYCICWWDAVNRTGEFEPVGTREKWRGRGLGKIVIREGLRRLQARGAQVAYVSTPGKNIPAQRLYESAGFTVYTREHLYGRLLP